MGCGSSTSYDESYSHTGNGHARGIQPASQGGQGDEEFIPPPSPAKYEEPSAADAAAHRRHRRQLSRAEEDEEMDSNRPAEVTNKGNDMRTQHMGRKTLSIDTRSSAKTNSDTSRPTERSGDLWSDDFTDIALDGADVPSRMEWKRPGDIADDPCLFAEGTTRFDIGQGSAGTCWFLSILASLADKPECINQVIPRDSYRLGKSSYDGVFHARFWRFGEWVDVYVDDCIPVTEGSSTPWGARSSTDPNEMWVSLMEKAFAKFHGGYKAAWGGWPGDAFIALTGGVAERVEMDDHQPKELFQRVKNALASGSVLSCSVPEEKDGYKGLVGGHAYTLTGAAKVPHKGKACPLFRIRNPWGKEKGEWLGPWADAASEWKNVSDSLKDQLQVEEKGDGEFWMSLKDYCSIFRDTHICNFTPDFDKDGTTDGLDQVCCIFGEWKGKTAAGSDDKKLENQKFTFTVSGKGLGDDGMTPVVIQFMQQKAASKGEDLLYIRADLLNIEKEFTAGKPYTVLDELTNYATYFKGQDLSYRYRLKPGKYMVIPTTMKPGQEKEFCIRIFSGVELKPSELKEMPGVFQRQLDLVFKHEGQLYETPNVFYKFGMWRKDVNAGGQISNRTFEKNPQYLFNLAAVGGLVRPRPITISLKQEVCAPKLPIGFKVYQLTDRSEAPLDLRYLYKHAGDRVKKDIAGESTFVTSYQGENHYMLEPGVYVIVLFTDQPGDEKKYVLSLAVQAGTKVDILKEFNTVTK